MALRKMLFAASLAALVVLAGCAAPVATETPSAEPAPDNADRLGEGSSNDPPAGPSNDPPTDPPDASKGTTARPSVSDGPTADDQRDVGGSELVPVENGQLPVNATTVYRRVERLLDADGPTPSVEIVDADPITSANVSLSPQQAALGYRPNSGSISECGEFYPARWDGDTVSLTPRNYSRGAVELVLAHEFTHALQPETPSSRTAFEEANYHLSQVLSEGSAVYLNQEYARTYDVRWDGRTPFEIRRCYYEHSSDVRRRGAALYYYGGRYFDQRLDSPANVAAVFDSYPRTSEQLVHGLAPTSEQPANLTVAVESSDRWQAGGRVAKGELGLRVWLSVGLDIDRVDEAATGWGNDTFLPFGSGDETAVSWVLRMDSESDAAELEAAVADLATVLEERDSTTVRQVRVSPDTMVVFAGAKPFVTNAEATTTDGTVIVTAPGTASE